MKTRNMSGFALFALGVLLTSASAQTYSILKEFTGSDGQGPVAPLVLSGNSLYGTTYLGGNSNWGSIFTLKTNGADFSTLRHFAGPTHTNGALPNANLILFGNTLFGTTEAGGSLGLGTMFRMNTNGSGYTVIRPFGIANENHVRPRGGLIVVNNTLFGTTYGKSLPNSYGTVFRVATNGAGFSAVMDLGLFPLPGDGRNPWTGLITSGPFLFGTTYNGGSSGFGTVFRIATNGTGLVFIKHFTGADGANPRTPLLLAANTLYGMTFNGGASSLGTIYRMNTNGTGYSVLKHFSGSDGAAPLGSLLLVSNYLYGTTYSGGAFDKGTIFRIHTNGSSFAVVKEFDGLEGGHPSGGLVRSGNNLYGATYAGGSSDSGIIFALNLGPVVTVTDLGNAVELSWAAAAELEYQVQYKTALTQASWTDLGGTVTASGTTATLSDPVEPQQQRFYRVLLRH